MSGALLQTDDVRPLMHIPLSSYKYYTVCGSTQPPAASKMTALGSLAEQKKETSRPDIIRFLPHSYKLHIEPAKNALFFSPL